MKEKLRSLFIEYFDAESDQELQMFFCPGRVNLLGEHIDYNGGWVLPAAISMGIYAVVRVRNDQQVHLASTLFDQRVIVYTQEPIRYVEEDNWANYPKGVMQGLKQQGTPLKGCDILFVNNLPLGAGLSSSAALEVLTAYLFLSLTETSITAKDRVAIAQLTQMTENNFIGMNCGIMDMFAVALGQQDQAVLLHCDTLDYQYIPLRLGEYQFVIMNTNKPRSLIESKYNERWAECQEALQLIQKHTPVNHLTEATLEAIEKYITQPVIARRTRHVVTENQRVLQATDCLQKNNLIGFGALMDASHQSLKEDYEVSGTELDTIVAIARQLPGCIGARMTGAGFGGCALALVHQDAIDNFKDELVMRYTSQIGYAPTCYPVLLSQGVRQLL